jgi:hypothetical protein
MTSKELTERDLQIHPGRFGTFENYLAETTGLSFRQGDEVVKFGRQCNDKERI